MDLLEELEDHGSHHQTYLDTQVIGNQDDFNEEETAEAPDNEKQGSMLGMNFNLGGISESLGNHGKPGMTDMPDMSILDKVRQRLYGDQVESPETQNVEDDDTKKPDEEMENNGRNESEIGGHLTQIVTGTSEPTSTQKVHILPQLSVDDAEIATQPKQMAELESTEGLFVSEIDEPIRPQTMTKEERLMKIAQLAEKKRQERLAKEKHQEELEVDITHVTLTDEENDLNDHNDSVVMSHTTDKQMKETDEFLNIKKREKIIQPEFKRKVLFTKDRLLSAFDDEGSEQSDIDNNSQGTEIKSSPVTSPLKVINKAENFANNEEEDENILSFLDAIHSPKQSAKQPQKNPIEIYAENLKQQLLSSPTKSTDNKVINLDSDFESGSNSESEVETQRMEIHDELKKIPQLSKEDKLSIKQKFSKKRMSAQTPVFASLPRLLRKIMSLEKNPNSTSFLGHLRKANINQLVSNKHMGPDNEVLEELEKDEEVMGTLLEREMEKVRNIRRKEKLRERAALALAGKTNTEGNSDAEYSQGNTDEEVPDSDMDSDHSLNYDSVDDDNRIDEEQDEEQEENGDDEDEDDDQYSRINSVNNLSKAKRKARRTVMSEDEDYGEKNTNEDSQRKRNDDSYMFGVVDNEDSLGLHNDDFITTVNTQKLKDVFGNGASLTQAFENGTQIVNKKSNTNNIFDNLRKDVSGVQQQNTHEHGMEDSNENYELFKNLKPRETLANTESQISEDINKSSILHTELPSFQDIIESDMQITQPDSISTQVDNPSQFDASTQIDNATQIIHRNPEPTDKTHIITPADIEDEDEDINPSTLRTGRKLIRKNATLNNIIEDDEKSEDEISPENIQQQIKLYEEKIRRKELKSRKKQKELERMGMKNIVEGEAEESEDEWHGLGGVDGDLSDDQANSEDEKMIDNNFNIDLKNDDLRRKFMEEYQIKDQKELEKLLDDIKNHRLTKRVNGNGFDIELSDEEDELLTAYRKQKLKEQRARLMENKKLNALAKNEKSKAFFDSIQDSAMIVNLDDDDDDDNYDEVMESQPQANTKNPFRNSTKENKDDKESVEEDIEEEPKKKTIRVEESFVQRQLSFLMKSGKDDYEHEQKISNRQHGFDSSDDEIEDLQALKSKSLSNLHCGKRSESPTGIDEQLRKRTHEDSDTDVDEEFMPNTKKPSIIKSFRLSSSQQGIQVKDGKQFSGVTISKQYKTASGSKASITYLSKNKKNPIKSLKEKQIERSLNNAKNNNTRLFNSGGFES